MPSYQIRFVGVDAPEPETLFAADVAEALRQARARIAGRASLSALLMFDGWLVTTLEAADAGYEPAAFDDPRFASAGIYVFGRPGAHRDEGFVRATAVPDASVT